MKKLTTLCIFLISVQVFGQELKRIIVTYPNTKFIKEIYFVLKSDRKTKHGEYFLLFEGKLTEKDFRKSGMETLEYACLKEKGSFNNNFKNGLWIYYSRCNSKLEQGNYENEKKIGIWQNFMKDGVVKQFDFSENKELIPIFPSMVKYPRAASQNGIEGRVTIKIKYKNCEPVDYEIVKDIGFECGKAAIIGLQEQRKLELKYGVENKKCDIDEELREIKFALN